MNIDVAVSHLSWELWNENWDKGTEQFGEDIKLYSASDLAAKNTHIEEANERAKELQDFALVAYTYGWSEAYHEYLAE